MKIEQLKRDLPFYEELCNEYEMAVEIHAMGEDNCNENTMYIYPKGYDKYKENFHTIQFNNEITRIQMSCWLIGTLGDNLFTTDKHQLTYLVERDFRIIFEELRTTLGKFLEIKLESIEVQCSPNELPYTKWEATIVDLNLKADSIPVYSKLFEYNLEMINQIKLWVWQCIEKSLKAEEIDLGLFSTRESLKQKEKDFNHMWSKMNKSERMLYNINHDTNYSIYAATITNYQN